eukprot:2818467-Pleurochrysis_carterae.AAC.2
MVRARPFLMDVILVIMWCHARAMQACVDGCDAARITVAIVLCKWTKGSHTRCVVRPWRAPLPL